MPENQNGGSVLWSWAEMVWVDSIYINITINPKGFKNLWGLAAEKTLSLQDFIAKFTV